MPNIVHSPVPGAGGPCPCGSGDVFAECCGRFLSGAADAPTAVQLMRSRYTAFALGDAGYLRSTWHPDTRPDDLDLDADVDWYHLEIVGVAQGGPFDRAGEVEFTALYRSDGDRGELHERSRFRREGRRWLYVDGDVDD